ncbi:hypothetical protein [Vibrio chagasii]|uniref:hypothetical protein n=1 Tax=Vibrio chagasii TaxID=170679 RepID=UPI003D9FD578
MSSAGKKVYGSLSTPRSRPTSNTDALLEIEESKHETEQGRKRRLTQYQPKERELVKTVTKEITHSGREREIITNQGD